MPNSRLLVSLKIEIVERGNSTFAKLRKQDNDLRRDSNVPFRTLPPPVSL